VPASALRRRLLLLWCVVAVCAALLPFRSLSSISARATLGKVSGFLVGCCEAFEYIVYVSVTVLLFGEMITQAAGACRVRVLCACARLLTLRA
jgi:hypothetical protein